MAPAVLHHLVSRLSSARNAADSPSRVYDRGPLAARAILLARDTATAAVDKTGITPPTSINNNGIFALFGILGAAICVAMIWFFFWAKNGGFHFSNNDWDDYKSTVLRRRGPNGTILSNATPSTNLGGGSIYKDVDDNSTEDTRTVITGVSGSTDMTGITGGVSDFLGREKRRKKREQRDREKERRREEKSNEKLRKKKDGKSRSSRKVNEDGILVDEMAEAEAQAHLRDYRHEKAARVGGINKASDGSTWDGSNPSHSSVGTESTVTSELMANREHTPTNTPKKSSHGGIRKVYSTADRNAAREQERVRSEARRLQDRGRASHSYQAAAASSGGRRDFSWQHGEDASTPLRQIEEGESTRLEDDGRSHVPGAWSDAGQTESDLGTKSYRHIIPGISAPSTYEGSASVVSESTDFAYAEEKRKQRQQRRRG
ncbi:hypothetical protein SEUCBS140593_000704 [Sporothrix eucalyptigena]|uniref:Endosomal spry domain-containing protein n=1 Tax=Sporothrix eucalyptigena TaxID=1812306 RepID=A0ABP0AS47_9PEZI